MNIAVLKLTPPDLAKPKLKLVVSEQIYSHETQKNASDSSVILATTWNTTQTFDSKGQPKDRDNDK